MPDMFGHIQDRSPGYADAKCFMKRPVTTKGYAVAGCLLVNEAECAWCSSWRALGMVVRSLSPDVAGRAVGDPGQDRRGGQGQPATPPPQATPLARRFAGPVGMLWWSVRLPHPHHDLHRKDPAAARVALTKRPPGIVAGLATSAARPRLDASGSRKDPHAVHSADRRSLRAGSTTTSGGGGCWGARSTRRPLRRLDLPSRPGY
jgi:hypothetical protein